MICDIPPIKDRDPLRARRGIPPEGFRAELMQLFRGTIGEHCDHALVDLQLVAPPPRRCCNWLSPLTMTAFLTFNDAKVPYALAIEHRKRYAGRLRWLRRRFSCCAKMSSSSSSSSSSSPAAAAAAAVDGPRSDQDQSAQPVQDEARASLTGSRMNSSVESDQVRLHTGDNTVSVPAAIAPASVVSTSRLPRVSEQLSDVSVDVDAAADAPSSPQDTAGAKASMRWKMGTRMVIALRRMRSTSEATQNVRQYASLVWDTAAATGSVLNQETVGLRYISSKSVGDWTLRTGPEASDILWPRLGTAGWVRTVRRLLVFVLLLTLSLLLAFPATTASTMGQVINLALQTLRSRVKVADEYDAKEGLDESLFGTPVHTLQPEDDYECGPHCMMLSEYLPSLAALLTNSILLPVIVSAGMSTITCFPRSHHHTHYQPIVSIHFSATEFLTACLSAGPTAIGAGGARRTARGLDAAHRGVSICAAQDCYAALLLDVTVPLSRVGLG